MPVKRRRLQQLRGRVNKCTTLAQLQAAIDNARDKLLFVHYTALWNTTCKKMGAFISDLSRKPEYSHIRFAEVDVQQVTDAVKTFGVKGLPGVQCWRGKECIENSVFNSPLQVLECLTKHAPQRAAGPAPWWVRLVKVLAVGAIAAAGWAAVVALQGSGESVARELEALEQNIEATRATLNAPRRRRRSKKEVRAAQKKLKALLQRKAELEARAGGDALRRTSGAEAAAEVDAWDDEESDRDGGTHGRGEELEEGQTDRGSAAGELADASDADGSDVDDD